MTFFLFTIIFVFGLIIGSFLNVVILRYNSGFSLAGRSKCFNCSKTLTSKELIPFFSFLWQRGKCRKCRSKISWQYPIVELLTGLMFVLLAWRLNYLLELSHFEFFFTTLFFALLFSSLLVISVYDLKHKIVPTIPLLVFLSLAFFGIFFSFELGLIFSWPTWLELFSGLFTALPFYLLWFVSSGRWIGFGDGNLALGAGWLFGFSVGFSAIVLAFWLGAGLILLWMLAVKLQELFLSGKSFTIKRQIPFGPFLALSYLLTFLLGLNVFNLTI